MVWSAYKTLYKVLSEYLMRTAVKSWGMASALIVIGVFQRDTLVNLKSEVFHLVRVFWSKLWSSQIWSFSFGGRGYSRVNFGHLKSEVFHFGGWGVFQTKLWSSQIWSFSFWGVGGYSRVNFGHLKSEVFHMVGYSGVNFGLSQIWSFSLGGVLE